MEDFEKLGVFYLGRPYSLKTKELEKGLLLYDSRDLVTHAVCVGMTGSGKTGLCIGLLEEAALDGIPAIVIDPKGDLPNLLLTFPGLKGEDFLPWINEEEARKKGLTPAEYAKQQAEMWKKGLADWGQSGERIQRLRDAAEFVIYTPGSNAGLPVSILKSFAAPEAALLDDAELLQERIGTTVTSLLGLLGIEADPIQSREHILLSTILGYAWKQGRDLDLPGLIEQIQKPPVPKVGVLELETFYPSKERFSLVMALNNLLAAPGFETWLEGEALDPGRMLHTPSGKPRVCIFSIAHLNDAERMFFVSLLLTQVLGWMRTQSGTTSLRAILYMDEIFGYFPPVANPPSKTPLLTLLKQARAYGLGVVLATQNPVDLDYKGLSNAGTWFLGRLQTERDKMRVLEGLEGAAASASSTFNRGRLEQILAGLGNRVFLMHNTHEDEAVVFQTRWAMSYLRGPLTREQIKVLMEPFKGKSPATKPPQKAVAASAPPPISASAPTPPAEVEQYFITPRTAAPSGGTLVYRPVIVGAARVHYSNVKANVNETVDLVCTTPVSDAAIPVTWDQAEEAIFAPADLARSPQPEAEFAELPAAATKPKSYAAWNKDFVTWLYGARTLQLYRSSSLRQISRPGESERDFRIRLQQATREDRDEAVEALRRKHAPALARLQERLRRAEQTVDREKDQASQQKTQTAISIGATLLGAVVGRRARGTTIGRATTAARGVGRSMKEKEDIDRAEENVETLKKQLEDMEAEFQAEAAALGARADPQAETLEEILIKPKKADISVQLLALAWRPYWRPQGGGPETPAA